MLPLATLALVLINPEKYVTASMKNFIFSQALELIFVLCLFAAELCTWVSPFFISPGHLSDGFTVNEGLKRGKQPTEEVYNIMIGKLMQLPYNTYILFKMQLSITD